MGRITITEATIRVVVEDYSNYRSRTCCNGGDYGYTYVYTRIGENKWNSEAFSTSEFFVDDFPETIYSTAEVQDMLDHLECFEAGEDANPEAFVQVNIEEC